MLEAVVVMPVALSLLFGGIEFGNLFVQYGTSAKSVRNAARYLARLPLSKVCDAGATGGQTIATNLAIYGNVSGTGTPLIPTTSTITFPGINCGAPVYVTVQAVVPYTPLMYGGIPYTTINFTGSTSTITHTELWIDPGNV
jgi:hypothetical protein